MKMRTLGCMSPRAVSACHFQMNHVTCTPRTAAHEQQHDLQDLFFKAAMAIWVAKMHVFGLVLALVGRKWQQPNASQFDDGHARESWPAARGLTGAEITRLQKNNFHFNIIIPNGSHFQEAA